ncbi:MAG: FkbM family methyltransferase [Myxococcota bacterium]|nr:FkbM family methyltransferase [Myxococcota bacterium]
MTLQSILSHKSGSVRYHESHFEPYRKRTYHVSTRAFILIFLIAIAKGSSSEAVPTEREPAPSPDTQVATSNYLSAFSFDDFEIVEVPNIGKFYIDPDVKGLVRSALRDGRPHSAGLIEIFEKYVRPGSTAIDAGAHIGSLTVPLARLVGPEGHVYAFEPQREVHRELYHNLQLNNLTQATALKLAVSSEPGFVEMMDLPEPFSADGWGRIGKGGEKVEARTLDSFQLSDVSLIKIDVEGHEIPVIQGAEKTIRSNHPVLVIETGEKNLTVLRPLLANWGYEIEKIENSWADYLAIHQDKEADPPSHAD